MWKSVLELRLCLRLTASDSGKILISGETIDEKRKKRAWNDEVQQKSLEERICPYFMCVWVKITWVCVIAASTTECKIVQAENWMMSRWMRRLSSGKT